MLALELEKQKEQEKLDEEIALKEVLKEQMGELRSREMEVRKKNMNFLCAETRFERGGFQLNKVPTADP